MHQLILMSLLYNNIQGASNYCSHHLVSSDPKVNWIFIHDSKEISGLHNIQCRNVFNAAIRHGEYWYGIAQRTQHLLSYWSLSLSLFHLYIPCLQCLMQHAVMNDCTNLSVPPPQHENVHRHTILMKVNMWCCWNATTVMLHTTKSEYTETTHNLITENCEWNVVFCCAFRIL